jgi:hypothetical protein
MLERVILQEHPGRESFCFLIALKMLSQPATFSLSVLPFGESRRKGQDLRIGKPASKESTTQVWASIHDTDQPTVSRISIVTNQPSRLVCHSRESHLPVAHLVGRVEVSTLANAEFFREAQVGTVRSA